MHSPNSGTPPCCRRQLLDWLRKPWPNRWLVASQYAFRWQPVRISVLFWVRFYRTRFIWPQCSIQQYHSDLSDQSAWEITV